jgi:hypothetical protein
LIDQALSGDLTTNKTGANSSEQRPQSAPGDERKHFCRINVNIPAKGERLGALASAKRKAAAQTKMARRVVCVAKLKKRIKIPNFWIRNFTHDYPTVTSASSYLFRHA